MHILRAVLRRRRLVAFALSCIMRASDPAHVPAHPLSSERLHLLCENAPNLSSFQSSKSAIVHHFFVKKASLCRFLAARRFSGTAFCRRKEIRAFHYAYFTAASGIDPIAPSQTAVFAAISGFPACIVSFPVCGRVSKNRRRSRALNAFREVIAATSAHIRSANRSCRLSAFNAKASSSSATLRARVVPLDSPPRKPLSTF